jgi:hypothetical protein
MATVVTGVKAAEEASWFEDFWAKFWPTAKTVGGHLLTFFVVEEVVEGKTRKVLDKNKLNAEAPHLVKTLQDEKTFNEMITKLDEGSRKSLEIWMAGSLGDNQRADVILTITQMDETLALERLRQLAAVQPDVYKTRQAFAFRLCKKREKDYIYARLTKEAQQALAEMWREFQAAKAEWDAWMLARSAEMDTEAQRIRQGIENRQLIVTHGNFFERFREAWRGLNEFPWE